ncbi:MAG: hypothetical protein AB1486_08995 [Planctomycetota bacterium]
MGARDMIAYCLGYRLSDDELVEVQLAVGEPVDLVLIPWLLPLRGAEEPLCAEPDLVRPHLRPAGIERWRNERVLLVAPLDTRWYVSLAEAIKSETGHYPLLVQSTYHRERLGYPGPLRILDMEAYGVLLDNFSVSCGEGLLRDFFASCGEVFRLTAER